jgi:hypothetical protein
MSTHKVDKNYIFTYRCPVNVAIPEFTAFCSWEYDYRENIFDISACDDETS